MGAAYSRCGLTSPLKIRLIVDLSWYSKVLRVIASTRLALFIILLMCLSNFNWKSMYTPISFSHSVLKRSCCPIWYWWLGLFDPIFIVTHLSGWNFSNHLSDQAARLSISFCSICESSGEFISRNTFVSSANKNTWLSLSTTSGRSFIYKTKSMGPRTLPCGIPLVTGDEVDFVLFMTTHWVLFDKNESIHPNTFPVIP